MKAVIMAGGYATRLWPITKSKAKPLLPIGRKRIIDYIYEKLSKFDMEILVSTNLRFAEDFRDWAKDKNVEVVVEETTKEEEKLGAVRALSEVTKNLNDDVLVVAGDNIFSFSLEGFVKKFEEIYSPLIALYDVKDKELAKRYGVAVMNGDRVVEFYEKPEKPLTTLVGIGIYALPKKVVKMLPEYVRDERKDNLGDFVSWLVRREDVFGYVFHDSWYDVGNPDSYIEAFKYYTESHISEDLRIDDSSKIIEPVVIEEGVEIRERSIVGPFAYIGRNCLIENSDISESVIFDEVILRKVKLWRSIIDEKCEIRNIELANSIIGGHAKIQRGE